MRAYLAVTISLLLGVIMVQAVTAGGKPAKKPGECPNPPLTIIACKPDSELPRNCTDDSNCKGDEKCCNYGCKFICKEPKGKKPGECPNPPQTLVACKADSELPRNCTDDSSCKGAEKCCNYGCMFICKEPKGGKPATKPGECPNPPQTLVACKPDSELPRNCTDDSSCKGAEKCCNYGCMFICKEPKADLISVCPAFHSSNCLTARPGKPQCAKDSDCSKNEKCCCVNCGPTCVPPVKVKPGRCPNIVAKCMTNAPDTCHNDSNCPNDEKCCKICGKSCIKPAKEPRGVCPKNDNVKSEGLNCFNVDCIQNSDCKADELCCPCEDGRKCVKPVKVVKAGKCPAEKNIPCSYKNQLCEDDEDCEGCKKCCNSGCGKQCQSPVDEKPGKCRQYATFVKCQVYPPPRQCDCDWQCEGNKKCCLAPCEYKCDDPQPKPGQCPIPKTRCDASKILNATCNDDFDCLGNRKCCTPLCTQQCTDPVVPEKPGNCPAEKDIPCSYKTQVCKADGDCDGAMKCCNSGCGKQCRSPAGEKPGECKPVPEMCFNTPDRECPDDWYCEGNQKCCQVGCTFKCIHPPVDKPGKCPAEKDIPCNYKAQVCEADGDCDGAMKCCNSGCGKQCRSPAGV